MAGPLVVRLLSRSWFLLLVCTVACNRAQTPAQGIPAPAPRQSNVAAKAGVLDQQRAELANIPTPMKSRYLSVTTANAWQNPFIVVGTDSLKVIVFLGDENPSSVGAGGLLRPADARKDIEEIAPGKLAELLSSLPQNAWPYGRVVAIEESRQAQRRDRVAMRRNMEQALQTLGNLGVIANEWNEPASAR